jgi:hypothetical protein
MKKMYALTFTNNGNGMDSRPYGATIAVSTDVEKLKAKMQECVEEDCLDTDEIEDFDGNEYDHNFQIYRESSDGMSIELESKLDFELTLSYEIQEVDVL